MTDLPIPSTSRTATRKPTETEIKLTKADLAFKNALLDDVEDAVKSILPSLVSARIEEELGAWVTDVVNTINLHEQTTNELIERINMHDNALAGLIKEVFPHLIPTEDSEPTE